MIVGADGASDAAILARSESLYAGYRLRRVYYSAFSPIPDASARLPLQPAPLLREHRLYQADWLLRFYGFARSEIVADGGDLDLAVDPKLGWALAHREAFPVDVNTADREILLRTPGLGVRTVERLLKLRRLKRLRLEDVRRLCRAIGKVEPFIVADDWSPTALADRERPLDLERHAPPVQLRLI
jgi:predicted DNA-binding helix-hairpin-helix protein